MGFGERLKELRESYGYSQKKLAGLVNVTDSAIANYEKGLNHPKIEVIIELMSILKCDANYLYQDYIPKANIWELSEEEHILITRYRKLNDHGKRATNCILNVEYERAEAWNLTQKKTKLKIHSLILKKDGYSISPNPKIIETVSTSTTDKTLFGIKIISNFEKPLFFSDDIILFGDKNVRHNQVGLFKVNGIVYIRKLFQKNDVLKLIPFNVSSDSLEITPGDEFEILGKYIGKLDGDFYEL